MLQNKSISIIYRIICLITFVIVILKLDNFIALALLTIAFYVFTRNESDSTHSPIFNQFEGLVVDEKISMADLKSMLIIIMRRF